MPLNKSVLTAGILVVAGFCSGFALSNGSGKALGMKPVHKARSKAGNADEVVAAGIFNAAAEDGPGEGNVKHPTLKQTGGGGGEGGEAQEVAGGGGSSGGGGNEAPSDAGAVSAASTGPGQADAAMTAGSKPGGAPASPSASAILNGADAAAFLRGNTVDAGMPNQKPHLVYYAPRGLRADGDTHGFVVKSWNPKTTSGCEPGPDGVLVCRPLQVRTEPGRDAAGERLGTMLVAQDRWVPVYKGNLMGVPDRIPFVDTSVAAAGPTVNSRKVTGKGQAAIDRLIGHPASIEIKDASPDQATGIVLFQADGSRLSMERPEDGADQADSIAITVGRWSFSKGLLCQSDGTPGTAQTCSRPEAWGKTSVRLVPVGKTGEQRLDILDETIKSRLQAEN